MNAVRTTYSDLTRDAADHLGRTLLLLDRCAPHDGAPTGCAPTGCASVPPVPSPEADQVEIRGVVAAHRDLTAALVHLGRSLMQPTGESHPRSARGADAALLEALSPHATARDWAAPLPALESPAGALTQAARLARAAADLWCTHRCARGGPRSPEASLMRHPSMLGAAIREWRELIVLAGAVAEQVVAIAPPGTPGGPMSPEGVLGLADFPKPQPTRTAGNHPAAEPTQLVDLTVARPDPRRASDPLTAVQDRVGHLRRVAWMLAESGSAPIPILANTAAIGAMLAGATARAHRASAARLDPAHPDRPRGSGQEQPGSDGRRAAILSAATSADLVARRWSDVARQVADLRSAHPSQTTIQVERVDLARLLERLTIHARRTGAPSIEEGLSEALQEYSELARHLAVAVRRAHDRGELYLRGRALPAYALPRHPELLEAKLADRPVPLPTSMLRELEAAYAELHGGTDPAHERPRRRPGPGDRSPAA